MEIAGLCDICGKPFARFTCALCGSRVCPACFNQEGKVCVNCARGKS